MYYNRSIYSRMLCEGSPLLFYRTSGPVTPPGMYQGGGRPGWLPAGQGGQGGQRHL